MSRAPLRPSQDLSYERPHERFRCGDNETGTPCPFGPTHVGTCANRPDCVPQLTNGRWECARTPTFGGPCEQGPGPQGECGCRRAVCQPIPSMRRRRLFFVIATTSLAVGCLLLVLGDSTRLAFVSPGPLSTHHASIEASPSSQDQCAACHAAALDSPNQWLQRVIRINSSRHGDAFPPSSMTSRCLDCHQTKLSQFAAHAHSMPPLEMARLTAERHVLPQNHAEVTRMAATRTTATTRQSECSGCHQEHQGLDHTLTLVADSQCAECHEQPFTQFSEGHPEFQHWPRQNDDEIRFPHQVHESKYYPEAKQAYSCRDCHVAGATIEVTRSVAYEKCASCHDATIQAGTLEGIPFWQLPILPTEVFESPAGRSIRWPELAVGAFDGPIPLLMQLMLAQDPAAVEILTRRGTTIDFFDFDETNPQDLDDAATLAHSIQQLGLELHAAPKRSLGARLSESLAMRQGIDALATLLQGVPELEFSKALDEWFLQEANRRELDKSETMKSASDSIDRDRGWHIDRATGIVRYLPAGHADPVLRALIDLLTHPTRANTAIAASIMDRTGQSLVVRQCTVCHQRQSTGDITWKLPSANSYVEFTHFSHGPHVTTAESQECRQCHRDETVAMARHDFALMTKSTCTACHRRDLAGDSCTQCHRYHIQDWQSAFAREQNTGEIRTATKSPLWQTPPARQSYD